MKHGRWINLGLASVGRNALVGGMVLVFLATSCSTIEESTQLDDVAALLEIESVPQGAEVYIARTPSAVLPGQPGGEWVARGGFGFVGRTPLRIEDQIIRSTKRARKVLSGGAVLYETTGPSVYQENERRIVLLKPGYRTVDVTEHIGTDTHLRLTLDREEGDAVESEMGPGGPEVLAGRQGRLAIVSVPSPAEVEVDGRYIGETPASVQLSPGKHQLLLHRAGHAPWRREIEILPASDQKVSAALEEVQQATERKSP